MDIIFILWVPFLKGFWPDLKTWNIYSREPWWLRRGSEYVKQKKVTESLEQVFHKCLQANKTLPTILAIVSVCLPPPFLKRSSWFTHVVFAVLLFKDNTWSSIHIKNNWIHNILRYTSLNNANVNMHLPWKLNILGLIHAGSSFDHFCANHS